MTPGPTLALAFGAALAALGTAPAAAQDCRLGDPDCQVSGATLSIVDESFQPEREVLEGEGTEMIVAVRCEGAAALAPTDIYFYAMSRAGLGGQPFEGTPAHWQRLTGQVENIGVFEMPEIPCGPPRSIRFSTAGIGEFAGTYYVTACLDTKLLAGPAERCTEPVTVRVQPRPRPDVAVSMSMDRFEATSGDVVQISLTAGNVGELAMVEGFIDVLWSRDQIWDGRADHRIALVRMEPLPPGETFRTTVRHQIEAGRGEIYYHACAVGVIGEENVSAERILANNCSETLSLSVR